MKKNTQKPVKKSYTKKSYAKKRTYKTSTSIVPLKRIMTYKYVQTITLGTGSSPLAQYTFRANSLYDPDYTSVTTGHQPLYFDEMKQLYSSYKVSRTKMHVEFMSTQGQANGNIIVGLDTLSNNASNDIDVNTIRERPGSKYATITPQFPRTLSTGWNLQKAKVSDEDNWTSDVSGNPANVEFLRVYAVSGDSTNNIPLSCITATVTLYYTAIMFDPVSVLGS